ncbi:MAG: transposase family protein, partial [Actinomycetota bacterium]|nr:transposase family protein [Actinomycetota bacterium]
AREGARFSRDLEDVVAWCAQRMDKTAVAILLGISWSAVARIVVRVVFEHIVGEQVRLPLHRTRLAGPLRADGGNVGGSNG